MDNKTAALTIGASAVGIALAIFGYNNYASNDVETIKNLRADVPSPKAIANEKIIMREKKVEVDKNNIKKMPPWRQFWVNEYDDVKKQQETQDDIDKNITI